MTGRSWVSVWVLGAIGFGFACLGEILARRSYMEGSLIVTGAGKSSYLDLAIAWGALCVACLFGAAKALRDWRDWQAWRRRPESGGSDGRSGPGGAPPG